MIYGSVCSGIEAATVAWQPLGWRPAFFSEIEKFPCELLGHHYGSNMPDEPIAHNGVPNMGDMNGYEQWPEYTIDILVGGTPCQDFSIAGLRAGLAGERGNLSLSFAKIAAKYRPRWLVWENVPGVLSSGGGRDFASILGLLSGQKITPPKTGWKKSGVVAGYRNAYSLAWRVLDAQYVRVDGFPRGVPQRRRRVFLVGYLGGWHRAAAVLFDREGLFGDTPPCRKTGQSVAALTATGVETCGADDNQARAGHLIATFDRQCIGGYGNGKVGSTVAARDYKSPSDLIIYTCALSHSQSNGIGVSDSGVANTLEATSSVNQAICAPLNTQIGLRGQNTSNSKREGLGIGKIGDPAFTLQAQHCHGVITTNIARKLTPIECERLMGFPDNYTKIPNKKADTPRYKALGNSMAVNCMRWIGRRIEKVEALEQAEAAE